LVVRLLLYLVTVGRVELFSVEVMRGAMCFLSGEKAPKSRFFRGPFDGPRTPSNDQRPSGPLETPGIVHHRGRIPECINAFPMESPGVTDAYALRSLPPKIGNANTKESGEILTLFLIGEKYSNMIGKTLTVNVLRGTINLFNVFCD